jgi:hypothetical protein
MWWQELEKRSPAGLSFDAVKHLVLCRIQRRPPRLNLQGYPYLSQATVATTLAKSYVSLIAGAGS